MMMIRRYEKWPSYNKFCCFGLFIQGPDRYRQYLSMILLIVPCLIFWAYTCPFLIRHHRDSGIVLTVISAFLAFITMLLLLITGNMDPGIMPRQPRVNEENPFQVMPKTRSLRVHTGRDEESKWCETCCFYRPPRVVHCGICSNCVEDFDHHCPWLGNCIGRRNYRFYLYFIWLIAIFCLFIFGACVWHVVLICVDFGGDFENVIYHAFVYSSCSWVLALYALIVFFLNGVLVVYHARLLFRNQTTYEFIRNKYPVPSTSPFYVGPFKYAFFKCCGSYRWNFVDRREWISSSYDLNSLEREADPPYRTWPPPSTSSATQDDSSPSPSLLAPSRSYSTPGRRSESSFLTTSEEHENPLFETSEHQMTDFD